MAKPHIPSSHDLARALLALPDAPLITLDDGVYARMVGLTFKGSVSWAEPPEVTPAQWVDDRPAVALHTYHHGPMMKRAVNQTPLSTHASAVQTSDASFENLDLTEEEFKALLEAKRTEIRKGGV